MSNQNSTEKTNKTTAKDLDRQAISGIQKYLASVVKITLAGVDYTPVTLTSALQKEIDAITAVDGVRSQLRQMVVESTKTRAQTRSLRAVLRKYILTTFGVEALQMLGDFGMKAPKNLGPQTVAAKAKAQATRKAKKEAAKKNAASEPAGTTPSATVGTTPAKQ
jgi:hypothetical protein